MSKDKIAQVFTDIIYGFWMFGLLIATVLMLQYYIYLNPDFFKFFEHEKVLAEMTFKLFFAIFNTLTKYYLYALGLFLLSYIVLKIIRSIKGEEQPHYFKEFIKKRNT